MRPQGSSALSRVRVATTDSLKPRRLPGVEGIWVFIGADSVVFAILFFSFMQDRLKNPALFEASRHTLNMHLGGIDTLILLTSSWSVALAVQAMKRDLVDREPLLLLGGAVTGLMFMVSKAIEYFQKFAHGITPGTNPFFMWYFTLTGIHLIHVVVGTSMLTYLWVRSRRGTYDHLHKAVPESVASYWHLVDLLWVVLFPLLYLMKAV
jgi:nitric oxide reductase NorE protein